MRSEIQALGICGLLCLSTVAATQALADAGAQRVFEGRAYKAGAAPGDSSALLYTEHHEQQGSCEAGHWRPVEGSVVYRHPDGSYRGQKDLDYRGATQRPSFTLVDDALSDRIEVINEDDRVARIAYEENQRDPEQFRVDLTGSSVIDAGFDPWIVKNWERLMAGETVDFAFLAPTRGELFGFEGLKVDSEHRAAGENVIRIQPSGFLIGFFADPIFLAYDNRRRLRDYIGLSNLRQEGGDNPQVHIRYEYTQTPACH